MKNKFFESMEKLSKEEMLKIRGGDNSPENTKDDLSVITKKKWF